MKGSRKSCALAAACGLAVIAGPAHAQVTWSSNLPDFYQHQGWGSKAKGGYVAAGKTESDWQRLSGSWGGWCEYTAAFNQVYFSEKRAGGMFGGLLHADTYTDAKWLDKSTDELYTFRKDYDGFATGDKMNKWLESKGHGPDKGVRGGLQRQVLTQSGADVKYIGAKGDELVLKGGDLFGAAQAVMNNNDSASLKLEKVGSATFSDKLWWTNFHYVTAAGYDAGAKQLWFADPDSNLGNADSNAGRHPDVMWRDNWDQAAGATGDDPTTHDFAKTRKYKPGDAQPRPGANPPAAADRDRYYMGVTIDKDKITDAAGNQRYKNISLTEMSIIHALNAAKKKGDGTDQALEITAGLDGSPIDEFWVYPADGGFMEESVTFVDSLTMEDMGWSIEMLMDPLNPREFAGLHVEAPDGQSLVGSQIAELRFASLTGISLDRFDVIFADGLSEFGLRVQTVGGMSGPDFDLQLEVPGPGVLSGLGIGLAVMGRKRARLA